MAVPANMTVRVTGRMLAAAIAVTAVLAGCGGGGGGHAAPGGSTDFSVLRAPRTTSDDVPAWVAHYVLESHDPRLSMSNVDAAHRVLGRDASWILSAPDGNLCLARVVHPLVAESDDQKLPSVVSIGCASKADAAAGKLVETRSLSTTIGRRVPTMIAGVVPNGVDQVVVRSEVDPPSRARVVRNAYEVKVVNPVSLSFSVRGSRPHKESVAIPSMAGARRKPVPYDAEKANR